MRPTLIITTLNVIVFAWLAGIELGLAETGHTKDLQEEPYRAIMHDDVERLKNFGILAPMPDVLPPLVPCDACLRQREAFGAYEESLDGIVVPDSFDVTTIDGRAILAHEYGHYLMTRAGIPPASQEKISLALGNMVYMSYFATASN